MAGSASPPADDFAQDRQAILAMAGHFQVRFRFVETVPLAHGYQLAEPFETSGLEWVQVLEDRGNRIVLQHVSLGPDGQVTKHWRQDWTYEPAALYEFRGGRTWVPRRVGPDEARGRWLQSVFEVDDSPRYAALGRWEHQGNVSSWQSDRTWRPLPRREHTRRSDYDVLVATNRHTLTPTGWVHEQDNAKLVSGRRMFLAREAGLNDYRRVQGVDFGPAEAYWARTAPFWSDVRSAWAELLNGSRTIRLRDEVNGQTLWEAMFAEADRAESSPQMRRRRIRDILQRYLAPD